MSHNRFHRRILTGSFFLSILVSVPAWSQTPLPSNRGFTTIREMLEQSCSACHSWTGSHGEITDPARILPFRPEESNLYLAVESDYMPLDGPRLTESRKLLIRTWIENGATADETPLAVQPVRETAPTDSAAQPVPTAPAAKDYGKLSRTINYHQVAGFTSAGLLLAAGAAGTAKWIMFMDEGHRYRESRGIDEPDGLCAEKINEMWAQPAQQTLRWTHVGLLVAGNGLYLGNALTGLAFPKEPEKGLTPRRIHRYAFYVHAALMATNLVLGLVTSSVLEHGTHDQVLGLAVAHSAVGLAVPLVMIGAGITVNVMR